MNGSKRIWASMDGGLGELWRTTNPADKTFHAQLTTMTDIAGVNSRRLRTKSALDSGVLFLNWQQYATVAATYSEEYDIIFDAPLIMFCKCFNTGRRTDKMSK
ncbi:hypothetical protein [Sphingorhabdus sp.]|uniref:hypothetical protein n=1 Tax=Sphingorhabdus sp. TaxID=1902408 RepID=UPI0032B7C359